MTRSLMAMDPCSDEPPLSLRRASKTLSLQNEDQWPQEATVYLKEFLSNVPLEEAWKRYLDSLLEATDHTHLTRTLLNLYKTLRLQTEDQRLKTLTAMLKNNSLDETI